MTGRRMALLMALALVGTSAYAKDKPSGDGGGKSGHSNSAASSKPESSSSAKPAQPPDGAQARHPRPGTGTGYRYGGFRGYRGYRGYGGYRGYRGHYGYRYYDPYYYSPFYYSPYSSWGYSGYSPYYHRGYYGYAPYRGGYRHYRESGSVRLLVDPEKTRVYVDGYYAGVADDFDGILQRLSLPPGRHEITLKLEGYRTHRFKVYVPVDQTLKIHHDMTEGEGEATEEVLGRPAGYVRDDERKAGRGRDGQDDDDDRYRRGDDDGDEEADLRDAERRGSVRLEIRPSDASVYVDGAFRGSGRDVRTIRLNVGAHRIEVVRPGYRTVEREIRVETGRPGEVTIELEKY